MASAAGATLLLDYQVPRPNLLDSGLSDYSFWVAYVKGLSPKPLPKNARTGRIWA
jgi:cyanobactin cluster PatC/TenC/TruC protein